MNKTSDQQLQTYQSCNNCFPFSITRLTAVSKVNTVLMRRWFQQDFDVQNHCKIMPPSPPCIIPWSFCSLQTWDLLSQARSVHGGFGRAPKNMRISIYRCINYMLSAIYTQSKKKERKKDSLQITRVEWPASLGIFIYVEN